MANEYSVKIENLTKIYHDGKSENIILENADFSIKKGEYISLIGRSGLGKSTLLKIIGTLEKPDSGKVYINGDDISNMSPQELTIIRRKNIGFVFQQYFLIPRLSIYDNLELPLIFAGVEKKERSKRISNSLDIMGLSKKCLDQNVNTLSGGEKQRIAVARALLNKPDIILADEPTGSLDEENEDAILEIFDNINSDLGVTLLVVTHNPKVADSSQKKITICEKKIVLLSDRSEEDVFKSHSINAG